MTERDDEGLTPENLRAGLIEVLRVGATWEAGQKRDQAPPASEEDELLLIRVLDAVRKHQREVTIHRGGGKRKLRRQDLAIPPGLRPAIDEAIAARKSGPEAVESALENVVQLASRMDTHRDLSAASLLDYMWKTGAHTAGRGPKRRDKVRADEVVKRWTRKHHYSTSKCAAKLYSFLTHRDSRYDADLEKAIAHERSSFPSLTAEAVNDLRTEGERDAADEDSAEAQEQVGKWVREGEDGLTRLGIEARARGAASGSLPPLRYILVGVLGYDRVRAQAATCLLEARRPLEGVLQSFGAALGYDQKGIQKALKHLRPR